MVEPKGNLHILEPCSDESILDLTGALQIQKVATAGGGKGQVWIITGPPASGLNATVDYVNHQVTVWAAHNKMIVRVGDGIKVKQVPTGIHFSVEKGYNVIPVYNPDTGELGYFKGEVPPAPGSKESE